MCTTAHALHVLIHQISRDGRSSTATGQRGSRRVGRNSHGAIAERQSEIVRIVYLGFRYPLGVAHVDPKRRLPDQEGLWS